MWHLNYKQDAAGETNTDLLPDRISNPKLLPGLATGLDLACEK